VLWDNTTRFIFTLAAAIIGLVAYYLLPSRKRIDEKDTASYDRAGKWMLFVFSFVLLGLAAVLGWEFFRYKVQNVWVGVNFGIFAVMGTFLLIGNIFTLRAVRHDALNVELVEAEVVELSAEEGDRPGLPEEKAVGPPPSGPPLPPVPPETTGGTPKE